MSAAPAIRSAQRHDAAGILALESLFPSDRLSPASVRRLLRSPSSRVWVAGRGPGLVAALILLTRRGSRVARIYSLAVHPAARGQGLARALVQRAQVYAARAGCERMVLEVRTGNRPARALYAGLGYVPAARLPGYYDDGGDGLRLQRPLTPGLAKTL